MEQVRDVRAVLFESSGARRFTQDSPVLPDVWIAYDRPGDVFVDQLDLLLTPHFGGLSGRVAKDLRDAVADSRRQLGRDEPEIAQLPGIVAAKLYLDELLRIVLPRTQWWQDEVRGYGRRLSEVGPEKMLAIIRTMKDRKETGQATELPVGFAWLIHLLAFLISENDYETASALKPKHADYLRAYEELCDDKPGFPSLSATLAAVDQGKLKPTIGLVAVNRKATTANMDSALAVKADAARLLFNVSCDEIVWAVIDGGIDGTHAAFAQRDRSSGAPIEDKQHTEKGGKERFLNRIKGTYDLTLVRKLLDPRYISQLFQEGAGLDPEQKALVKRYRDNLKLRDLDPDDAPKLANQLRERLEHGFELDWGLLEPFLWVKDPPRPSRAHGTMVAGILAADWREPPAPWAPPRKRRAAAVASASIPVGLPWTIRMQGICPDIKLYDFRVIGEGDDSREFEVLAALQLIRHLNELSDRREIHGANLSLSTEHDVTSYACGSTLVCQECDRTWASGVVLVAAAGNRGHERYLLAQGRELGGYHTMSITDPGNAEGVITVGATHRNQPHQYGVSYFSSRGPTGDGRRKPDLVAPGEKVVGPTPYGNQGTDDGTSFAAPHVSGAAAMLMARNTELIGRPQKIKELICATATDLGRERYFQGAGMLDILRALQSV